jgi:hypothetical protein
MGIFSAVRFSLRGFRAPRGLRLPATLARVAAYRVFAIHWCLACVAPWVAACSDSQASGAGSSPDAAADDGVVADAFGDAADRLVAADAFGDAAADGLVAADAFGPAADAFGDAADGRDASDGGAAQQQAEAGDDAGSLGCTPFDSGPLDEASVAAGLNFIRATGHCYRCHQPDPDAGITLSGNDNSVVDGGAVYPPNLTPEPLTGLGCWSNDQIATAILYGVDNRGLTLCRVMPRWGRPFGDGGPPLNDASVLNVVAFLRSLAPVFHEVCETTCPTLPDDAGGE